MTNPQDLKNDFDHIYKRIDEIYAVKITKKEIKISPRICDTSNSFWASEENSAAFNKHVPAFKSLLLDMYSFIETISKHKFGKYEIEYFESKHSDYKEFRMLNNVFKHAKKKEAEITLTKIVHISTKQFDLMCNFKYIDSFKCLMYSSFVILFFEVLIDLQIITEGNFNE